VTLVVSVVNSPRKCGTGSELGSSSRTLSPADLHALIDLDFLVKEHHSYLSLATRSVCVSACATMLGTAVPVELTALILIRF